MRQWEEGIEFLDWNALAAAYAASTDQCARLAHLIAIGDERFVQHLHQYERGSGDGKKKHCIVRSHAAKGCVATKIHIANEHRLLDKETSSHNNEYESQHGVPGNTLKHKIRIRSGVSTVA